MGGIEPPSSVYKAAVLPLNYTGVVAGEGVAPSPPAYETGVLLLDHPALSSVKLVCVNGGRWRTQTPGLAARSVFETVPARLSGSPSVVLLLLLAVRLPSCL